MKLPLILSALLVALVSQPLLVQAVTIDFDTLSDSEPVTTQFPGLTFTNATALTAGITLNEFEFPPHSGANVIFDDGGPMSILFAVLQASVGGFFTYLTPLTLTAFDGGGGVVATETSAFSSNLALSGDAGSSPNELLTVAFATGITTVTIQGDTSGSSLTLDDLTFSPLTSPAPSVPAPSSLFLMIAGLALSGLVAMATHLACWKQDTQS